MKKIALVLLAVLMLAGCSRKQEITNFMVINDKKLSALYNSKGDKLTDYQYKTYQEIEGLGYIVTDEKDQVGFINNKGEQTIPFGVYQTLQANDHMLLATKKVEKEKPVQDNVDYENLYILSGKGEVLYSASQDLGIRLSTYDNTTIQTNDGKQVSYNEPQSLPIIVEKNKCTVLYQDGQEFVSGENIVSAYQIENGTCMVVNYSDYSVFYDFYNDDEGTQIEIDEAGDYAIFAIDTIENKTALLYDKKTQGLIAIDREQKKSYYQKMLVDGVVYDDANNIILTQNQKQYIYVLGNQPIELTSYYKNGFNYLQRSSQVYGPHKLYTDTKGAQVLEDCQLYPTPYLVIKDQFPVFVKKKGYMYYNFQGKNTIKDVYLDAKPFDINGVAIVKKDDKGSSLIDESGSVLTSKKYAKIEAIGGSYYAVYEENGTYGVVDTSGEEVLPMEYTTLPKQAYIRYDGRDYLLLNKNGRSYLYDVEDEVEEVLSIESALEFNEKGYFTDGNVYYTFDGERIN